MKLSHEGARTVDGGGALYGVIRRRPYLGMRYDGGGTSMWVTVGSGAFSLATV